MRRDTDTFFENRTEMYGPKPCSRRLPKCWQDSKPPATTSKSLKDVFDTTLQSLDVRPRIRSGFLHRHGSLSFRQARSGKSAVSVRCGGLCRAADVLCQLVAHPPSDVVVGSPQNR